MNLFTQFQRLIAGNTPSRGLESAVKQNNYSKIKQIFHTKPQTHSSNIFILASGEGTRWEGSGHKQLAIVNKKPIIKHTLDQVKKGLVVTHHKKLQKYPHITPSNHNFVLETLLSTHKLWKDQTIVLLGDVYFNEADLNKILSFKGDFGVFGSKSQVEIFALSFSKKVHKKILKHLLISLRHAYCGGRGKLWEFYHSFVGLPLYKIGFGKFFIDLKKTTDVDNLGDYYNLIHNISPKPYL